MFVFPKFCVNILLCGTFLWSRREANFGVTVEMKKIVWKLLLFSVHKIFTHKLHESLFKIKHLSKGLRPHSLSHHVLNYWFFFVGYFSVFSDLLWIVSVNMVKKYRKSSGKLAVTIILIVLLNSFKNELLNIKQDRCFLALHLLYQFVFKFYIVWQCSWKKLLHQMKQNHKVLAW